MDPSADALSRVRGEARYALRRWSTDALAFVLFLCGAFTLLTVMTGFFPVFVGITAVVYAFAAWVIVRSYRPARGSVAYFTALLDGLRGHILDARALDAKDEIPHGKAILILDNELLLHLDGPRLEFLRLYTASGEPFLPTLDEATAWVTALPAPDRPVPSGSRGAVLASLPELRRLVAKWSARSFGISFRSALTPAGRADDVSLDRVLGSARRSATLTIRGTRIAPAEILREKDAIRNLLDSLGRVRQKVPAVSPYA